MKKTFLLILLVAALLLSSCGGKKSEGPVTLRLWTHANNAFNTGYDALIAAYQAEHPNVTIQRESFDYELYLQTLQTAMPAGEEADILQLFGTWTSQYYERLAPVPEDVMTLADAQEIFYAAPIGGYVIDGKLYGFPQEFNCEYGGVLVNKTMFEAAGIPFPPQWKTMDDVLADAVKLAQKDDAGMMSVAGFHFTSADPISASFLAGIKQRGGDYWNADRTGFTFNTPEAKAQLQWMVDAVNMGVVDPVVFNDGTNFVIDAFFTNKVAIGYIGAWAIAEGRNNYPDFKDEWDYIYLPPVQGEGKFVAAEGKILERLRRNGQIVFQYCDAKGGFAGYPENPNGSADHIAGICDETGRILGLMPHPERHREALQHPRWTRMKILPAEGDGLNIFRNGVEYVKKEL